MEGEEGDSIKIAMDQYYQDEFNDQYDEGRRKNEWCEVNKISELKAKLIPESEYL